MKFFDRSPSAPAMEPFFDSLEPRLALYAAPFLVDFPDISEMASPQNTVVRMQTNVGIIDIEMYDRTGPDGLAASAAPITTQNFLRYINAGHLDQTFFHRLDSGFVIQGGQYRLEDGTPVQIPTFSPIQDEFNAQRSNIARTLAMAKAGPDTATSQFFFNLGDNLFLDEARNNFAVFARVISGWDVVEDITGLNTRPLPSLVPGGASQFAYPTVGSEVTDVVSIVEIGIIKPSQIEDFYDFSLYFPDGYRSGNSSAIIDLINLDPNSQTKYEIVARFETAARDTVIASGTLAPGAHLAIPVYTAGDPSLDKVRGRAPFAYEIRATDAVAASLTHSDFGATTSQAFVNPRDFDAGDLQEWTFAFGQKGTGVPSFLTWQNLSDERAELTVMFTAENGEKLELVQSLDGLRRGGLNVNLLQGLPTGPYSVTISSDQPIIASLSQYRTAPGRAAMETAPVGGASTHGVLPGAIISSDGLSLISVALPQVPASPVIVDFEFILSDGTVLTSSSLFVLDADNVRRDIDLSAAHGALPEDEFFTIRYEVRDDGNGAMPISASYVALTNGQTMRSSFQTLSSQQVHFAGGYTDIEATENSEFISIYNPHLDPNVEVTYRIRFHFAEEIVFPGGLAVGLIGAGESIHIPIRALTEIINTHIGSTNRVYGMTVTADIQFEGAEVPGAIFAQYTRLDTQSGSASAVPTLGGEAPFPRFFLNNPIFG